MNSERGLSTTSTPAGTTHDVARDKRLERPGPRMPAQGKRDGRPPANWGTSSERPAPTAAELEYAEHRARGLLRDSLGVLVSARHVTNEADWSKLLVRPAR